MSPTKQFRGIAKIFPRPSPHWVGDGMQVHPVFADRSFTQDVSPFLMFDYAAPNTFAPKPVGTKPLGVGQHPHRGFETVTLLFQGEAEHRDSAGNAGIIGPGDVQWMTAGRGIVHEEHHSQTFTETGGTMEMAQLWVNLRASDKMTSPKYQPILKDEIPIIPLYDGDDTKVDNGTAAPQVGTARLVAGELNETKGPASTFSPVEVWELNLPKAGTTVEDPLLSSHNCILFVRRGEVQVVTKEQHADGDVADQERGVLRLQQAAILTRCDSRRSSPTPASTLSWVKLRVQHADTSVIVLAGEPIDEPIAARGPFVMNTDKEIQQAFLEYRSGQLAL